MHWFSTRGDFVLPPGMFVNVGRHLRAALHTSRVQRTGMMLNILQCTEQAPTAKAYLVQRVNSAQFEKIFTNGYFLIITGRVKRLSIFHLLSCKIVVHFCFSQCDSYIKVSAQFKQPPSSCKSTAMGKTHKDEFGENLQP